MTIGSETVLSSTQAALRAADLGRIAKACRVSRHQSNQSPTRNPGTGLKSATLRLSKVASWARQMQAIFKSCVPACGDASFVERLCQTPNTQTPHRGGLQANQSFTGSNRCYGSRRLTGNGFPKLRYEFPFTGKGFPTKLCVLPVAGKALPTGFPVDPSSDDSLGQTPENQPLSPDYRSPE
ncbi:MAG: hypothetical protein ABL962_15145, partial [Fimbriimonadaceae bacterium]